MRALFKDSQNFPSVCIMLILCTMKRPYHRHWIPARNMFTYFCYGWFFKIVFTSIYSFNKRFKICINNRWCLIIFQLLIKLQYLNFFSRHYNNTKISIFTYFFMRFKFVFCSKRMKKIQTVRIPNILWRYSS